MNDKPVIDKKINLGENLAQKLLVSELDLLTLGKVLLYAYAKKIYFADRKVRKKLIDSITEGRRSWELAEDIFLPTLRIFIEETDKVNEINKIDLDESISINLRFSQRHFPSTWLKNNFYDEFESLLIFLEAEKSQFEIQSWDSKEISIFFEVYHWLNEYYNDSKIIFDVYSIIKNPLYFWLQDFFGFHQELDLKFAQTQS